MIERMNVLVLGAGDLATGIVRRLVLAGARVAATEIPAPLTVRRLASFSEAVWEGRHEVEGVTAVRCTEGEIDEALARGEVPLLVDPEGSVRKRRRFNVLVDARMAKRSLGTAIGDAPVVIGIGPGFTAGRDCHAVVETLQGAGMGRAIFEGSAAPDTGEPCSLSLAGAAPDPSLPAENRVLRAPADGILKGRRRIGDRVEAGETVAEVAGSPVVSTFRGVLRGLVHDGVRVTKGLKIGEVDLTGKVARCRKVSEKANAVAGGVLEACFVLLARRASSGADRPKISEGLEASEPPASPPGGKARSRGNGTREKASGTVENASPSNTPAELVRDPEIPLPEKEASSPRVSLGELAEAMMAQSDETETFVDRRNGRIDTIFEETLRAVEDGDDEEDAEVEGRWDREERKIAREILEGADHVPIPSRFDIHEWEMLADFSGHVEDEGIRGELLDAIHGRGAFRMFRTCVERHGLGQQWFRFRESAFREIAREWCRENGIGWSEE
jgi:xanthine dehydrogenase accessory factor